MSFEEILQAHTDALNNHAAALRGEGVPAFVKNQAAAGEAAAPKADGRKKKAAAESVAGPAADPTEDPAFKAIVSDVMKLVDLDNLNKTTRIADTCAQFGVKKAGQLTREQWPQFHAALKQQILEASAPPQQAASSFV